MRGIVIVKRLAALVADRKTADQTLEVIQKFVVPFRGEFFKEMTNEGSVEWRRREIYDSTAPMACQILSSSIQGALTSAATRWFGLRFRQKELNKDTEVMRWLEECENIIYKELEDSNFDLESSEFYIDLTSFGTAIIVEEVQDELNWDGIDFQAAPCDSIYFEEDAKGQIKRLYRILKWTALQIVDKFGEENVPQMIKDKAAATSDVGEKLDVIFAIYDRKNKKNANIGGILDASERPFGYKYILKKDGTELGEEGGYYEMPAFVARWRKAAGSKLGHSPAHVCLSDILTLNELTEETLEALGKVVDPATITTERGLMSDLDLGKGGLTIVRDIEEIKPYESRARFDVGELKIGNLQNSINRAFFVDQLEMKDSPSMTATEAQIRYELMQRLLGPTMGRMKNDFLDPLVKRTFNILHRAGQLPEMPDKVKELEGELDIKYTGPMARAQQSQDSQAVERWVNGLAGLAEIFPELLDLPNVDEIGRGLANLNGVPAE
ncbi:hypothetical protein KA005_17835, partial [bacterium]|nr:hypothetical protein [bacterium]